MLTLCGLVAILFGLVHATTHINLLTLTISLRDVSVPRLKSVPGTLLLMVLGITIIGIFKDL